MTNAPTDWLEADQDQPEIDFYDLYPSPSDPGDFIFAVGVIELDTYGGMKSAELLEYEYDGAFCYINEGVGFEYFVTAADHGDVEIEEYGVYVCEGLTVYYTRGDGWETDDNEDWEDYETRPATIEEIGSLYGYSFWDCI